MKNRCAKVGSICVAGLVVAGVLLQGGCAYFGKEEDTAEAMPTVPITPLPPEPIARPVVEPKWTPPPVEYKTYTVQKGDTLSGIAYRYGVRVGEIVEVGGIANPNRIRSGQVIKLPAHARDTGRKATARKSSASKKSASSGGTAGKTVASGGQTKAYTVKAGDTLASIAAMNQTTVDAIRQANNLTTDSVAPGRTLTIVPPSKAPGAVDGGKAVGAGDGGLSAPRVAPIAAPVMDDPNPIFE